MAGNMWGSPRGKNLKLLAVRPEGHSPLLPPLLDKEHAVSVVRHDVNGPFSPLAPIFNARDSKTLTARDKARS